VVGSLVAPWSRLPSWAEAVPPLAYLVVVALLRQAEGGATSGYAPLVFLPIVWLALYGSRAQLLWGAAAATAVLMVPIVAVGPPDYPASEWRRAAIMGVVGPLIGLTVHLVTRLRANESELATMASVVRGLRSAPQDLRGGVRDGRGELRAPLRERRHGAARHDGCGRGGCAERALRSGRRVRVRGAALRPRRRGIHRGADDPLRAGGP
jgi:hypothetical protein